MMMMMMNKSVSILLPRDTQHCGRRCPQLSVASTSAARARAAANQLHVAAAIDRRDRIYNTGVMTGHLAIGER